MSHIPCGTNSRSSLLLPCDHLTSEGHENFPQILAPRPDKDPAPHCTIPGLGSFVGAPDAQPTRKPPGTLSCRELALVRPQKWPKGEEQERNRSRQCRHRHCQSLWSLGDFSSSFAKSCRGWLWNPPGSRKLGLPGSGQSCPPTLFPLHRNQTTSGPKGSSVPLAGHSHSSAHLAEAAS